MVASTAVCWTTRRTVGMGNQSSFQSDQGRLPMTSFRKGSSSRRTAWALTIATVAYAQGITADLASSQQASGGHRVGILSPYTSSASSFHEDVKRGLTALGYVEGQTIEFESRFANGQTDQIPALAAELVQRRVNVIVTTTTRRRRRCRRAGICCYPCEAFGKHYRHIMAECRTSR